MRRLPENPLISPADVQPSRPDLEVVCAFNPGATRMGDEIILLLRVAERPKGGMTNIDPSATMLDLTGPEPVIVPADHSAPPAELVGIPLLDWNASPPSIVVRYLRRDMPGLDLSDSRIVRYGGAVYLTSISHMRLARSRDGIHFEIDESPAFTAQGPLEEFGVEDPRITEIDGTYYINYTAVSRRGIATALASTSDFHTYSRHGVIFCPENRDVTIFPAKVGDRYVALHRPVPAGIGAAEMWLAYSTDLLHWGDHRWVLGPRPGKWDSHRLGGGAVPVRVPEGWLEIYHGVDQNGRYALGAVLLDAEHPDRVLARSPEPIMVPEADFETKGFYGNVVFSCGAVIMPSQNEGQQGDTLRVYYGAADAVTAAADFTLAEIVGSLT